MLQGLIVGLDECSFCNANHLCMRCVPPWLLLQVLIQAISTHHVGNVYLWKMELWCASPWITMVLNSQRHLHPEYTNLSSLPKQLRERPSEQSLSYLQICGLCGYLGRETGRGGGVKDWGGTPGRPNIWHSILSLLPLSLSPMCKSHQPYLVANACAHDEIPLFLSNAEGQISW